MNITLRHRARSGALGQPRWLPLLLIATTAVLAGCGDKKDSSPSQTAARVGKAEITVHQINFVLQQQRNLRPEQADAASKQILERLIEQQLTLEKAEELKVDRDPRVMQQLDAARREVLARAYLEKIADAAAKPTPEEIAKYYADKPALFRERRIYNLQELSIEAQPNQLPELRDKLNAAKNINEFTEYLKNAGLRFQAGQALRAAEQLPIPTLDALAKLQDGQAMVMPSPTGAQVLVVAGSRLQPVTEEQARPAIEQFLLNERRRKLMEDEVKTLRAGAKVEYVGSFVQSAASAAAGGASAAAGATTATTTAAPAVVTEPAAAPLPAASGLSSSDINKGLGIK
ncbi:MAG: EpsD family peptidyl-prolyl cis-trans isomerase [Rubrivivax sp.]|nr:EpsD family peptidyl-prolyl cis-trans isomerase [Rubrivivax sp.]